MVVVESSSSGSEVTEDEELEIADGRETAKAQGRRMEHNLIGGRWASWLPPRMRQWPKRRSDAWFKMLNLPPFNDLLKLDPGLSPRMLCGPDR